MRATILFFFLLAPVVLGAELDRTGRLIEELANAPGPSGFEGPVRAIISRELAASGAAVSTDGLGSVIGVVRGTADRPRIMLVAHMDEVGLMVRRIDGDGYLRVQVLGGFSERALADKRWTILTHKGPVPAVSGLKSVHITSTDESHRTSTATDVFLDVGAKSAEEVAALGIRVGDPIAPWSPFTVMAGGRYAAKAFDDRIGCAMLVETARRLKERNLRPPSTIYFVGSVQEEVGLRGARTATQTVKPDLGMALEVGVAGDHPGVSPEEAQSKLGGGPSIFLYEGSMLPNLKLRDLFMRTAEQSSIPLQMDIISRYGQDSSQIQKYATGTPTIAFSVPTRYLHTHISMIDRSDFDRAVDLLVKVLMQLDQKAVSELASF
ncbi:MAG TPA: M42 family metallopeptidase [Thermoanaerobaculia bacterium]|nr:M42 family metallopeptidase [Thermoanaerobaculia bacterium]